MKLKKFLLLLPLFLMTVVMFTACGDDDEPGKNLAGTWVYAGDDDYTETMILSANGTGSVMGVEYDGDSWSYTITWTATETVLTVTDNEGDTTSDTYNLVNDNMLIWDGSVYARR